ncbi:MAG TPA: nuclear transport factor 2 family protein [Kofleriaceae bacterium]
MTSGRQPSRALLIAAGVLTQMIGAVCLVLALTSLPIAHDLKTGISGVIASVVAALAAIICGTFVWRGRLVPLALAAGLDVGFGIGLPRGGSAIGALLRILPPDEIETAETLIMIAAVVMFIAAVLCVLAVPSALKLRQWARDELARDAGDELGRDAGATDPSGPPQFPLGTHAAPTLMSSIDEVPTRPRPRLSRPSASPGHGAGTPGAGDTLRGFGAVKLMPTQVLRVDTPRSKPLVIAGVAVTLIAIGIIVITAATGSEPKPALSSTPSTGSAFTKTTEDSTTGDPVASVAQPAAAGSDASAPPPAIDDFVTLFHAALATASAADLGPLLDAKAFAFGVDSHDIAEGRDAIVAQLREDLGEVPAKGFAVTTKFSHVASDGAVGWLAQELRVGSKTFVISAVLALRDNAWTIAALHWAQAMPNDTAYRLAREGELAVPDAIPDAHDESPLAAAMRTGFASKPSFVEARSTRTDAFNFGSAGEKLKTGDAIKRIFGKIKATIRLHDAVKVGTLGERGGWGVANVDFTDADRDGTEVTQTFRVLAAWVKEDAGWRIVQTQWSNAR